MEPKKKSFRGTYLTARVAVALLLSTAVCRGSAQVISGLQTTSNISAYATLPVNVTPDYGYYAPVLFGYSLGGFWQSPYLIGAEVRGTIQRRLNREHQESALAGPRVAMRFGSFIPYVSVLGGAGNGWRFREPPLKGETPPKPVEDTGPMWTVLGGLDVHLNHHFAVRVGEISYSKIYLKDWTLGPVNVTAGIVYRLN